MYMNGVLEKWMAFYVPEIFLAETVTETIFWSTLKLKKHNYSALELKFDFTVCSNILLNSFFYKIWKFEIVSAEYIIYYGFSVLT